jgi:O-antigen/teichoic acid export membrane protein
MNVRAALVRNTAWYGVVTIVGLLSGLAMSVILARGLGPALMGDLSYVTWAERTLTALATLGYTFATARYTAEALARDDVPRGWSIVRLFMRRQLVTTVLVTLVTVPLVLVFAPASLKAALLVVIATLLPITIENIYTHALQGAQRYDVTAGTSTIKMTLQLGVAALAIWYGAHVAALMAALGLTLIVSCLIQRGRTLAIYRDGGGAPAATMTGDLRAFLLPLSIVAVLDTIVWDRSEVFFLGLSATSSDIAFYSLAFGLATRIMIIPGIAVGALLPAFSALHGRGDPHELSRLYQAVLRGVALVGVPLAALVAALAPALVFWLYGEAYLPAAPLVGVLAAVALISALRQVAWAALRSVGDRRCALTATAVAAVLNVGLAALLIPSWTTVGAVIANTIGQLTATVWAFTGMARTHGIRFPTVVLAKTAILGVLTWLVASLIVGDSHDLGWVALAAAAGVVVFVAGCVPAGLLGLREWNLLTTSTRRLLAMRASSATTPS